MVGVNNAINATLYDKLRFDFLRDIRAGRRHRARRRRAWWSTRPSRHDDVAEFIAYAKANPGKINMGSVRHRHVAALYGELFMQMTGVAMVHVPYRGSPQSLTGLLAGEVQAMFDTLSISIEHIRAGRLRALGVTSAHAPKACPRCLR